jgi:hypothetical protein
MQFSGAREARKGVSVVKILGYAMVSAFCTAPDRSSSKIDR